MKPGTKRLIEMFAWERTAAPPVRRFFAQQFMWARHRLGSRELRRRCKESGPGSSLSGPFIKHFTNRKHWRKWKASTQ